MNSLVNRIVTRTKGDAALRDETKRLIELSAETFKQLCDLDETFSCWISPHGFQAVLRAKDCGSRVSDLIVVKEKLNMPGHVLLFTKRDAGVTINSEQVLSESIFEVVTDYCAINHITLGATNG